MQPRQILHCDCNCFYAAVEAQEHPEYRGKQIAVCGNPQARHGIVLTASYPAKRQGVKTGMAIWQAQQRCRDLIIIPPHYSEYVRYSGFVREIFEQYTDQVEPFGLDESWLDVTGSCGLFGNGMSIAKDISRKVKKELGITVSIGVANNKISAKLGSDYKKPDAITRIEADNYEEIAYPLPVEDLLYVGAATKKKLHWYGIRTIGDLAKTNPDILAGWFGKMGYILHSFANGYENSPVAAVGSAPLIKSVGNGITAPRDLTCEEDIKSVQYVLTESVARRLREHGLKGRVVSIGVRDKNLFSFTRQIKLPSAANDTRRLQNAALKLFNSNYSFDTMPPVRALSVSVSGLCDENAAFQLDMFEDNELAERLNRLNHTVDRLKDRFGSDCVRQAFLLKDRKLTDFDPYGDNIIHPVSYFR